MFFRANSVPSLVSTARSVCRINVEKNSRRDPKEWYFAFMIFGISKFIHKLQNRRRHLLNYISICWWKGFRDLETSVTRPKRSISFLISVFTVQNNCGILLFIWCITSHNLTNNYRLNRSVSTAQTVVHTGLFNCFTGWRFLSSEFGQC